MVADPRGAGVTVRDVRGSRAGWRRRGRLRFCAVTCLSILSVGCGSSYDFGAPVCPFGGSGGFGSYPARRESSLAFITKSLDAFQREREATDEIPRDDCAVEELELEAQFNTGYGDVGQPEWGDSRLVLDELPQGRSIYLIPTDTAGVCAVVVGSTMFMCSYGDQPEWQFWNPDDGPPYVFGTVENAVERMKCGYGFGGERAKAYLGENAFYCELPEDADSASVDLLITYESGHEREV